MSKGLVLIIEEDEWDAVLLTKYLSQDGFDVSLASSARIGLEKACELLPDCIVCDVVLPDIDGFWVAHRVRAESSPVALTPFLFLVAADDAKARVRSLNVGADAYLTKPVRHDELVAQVSALIAMAERLRSQRDSYYGEPPSQTGTAALRGDIAQLSLATLLALLEMERRTGKLKVRTADGTTAVLELAEGTMVRASLGEQSVPPIEAMCRVLSWKDGRFWFRTAAVERGPERPESIGGLLLEAMRLKDEAER